VECGTDNQVIEDLADSGRLNGTNFCIECMTKKPLRSKHCRNCDRCVAKFDQYVDVDGFRD
jgi:ribosomal protein L40E